MRRSAAPSQLNNRVQGQFKPPFVNPPAKRLCTKEVDFDVKDASRPPQTLKNNPTAEKVPVRSPSDILFLLKKQPLQSELKDVNPHLKQANNIEEDHLLAPMQCNKEEEFGATVPGGAVELCNTAQRILSPSDQNKASYENQPDEQGGKATAHSGRGMRPLNYITPKMSKQGGIENQEPQQTKYYSVVWCKRSNKKHKKWEGDAILITKGRSVTLKDTEGKDIGHGSGYRLTDLANLEDGSTLPIGGKEVEIQGVISAEDYSSGQCFEGSIVPIATTSARSSLPPKPKPKPFRLPTLNQPPVSASNFKGHIEPLYDHTSPDALVMPRPPSQHQWRYNIEKAVVVDVVVDPHISKLLRPHQHEGVIFLYECVMGYKFTDNFGAILADEMGLGKTLQCITLVWTLLKQGPYGRQPVIKRVLIVTPSSLSANWGKEFRKWLGKERLGVYIVDQNNKVEQYVNYQDKPVMIISYEMFMRSADAIEAMKFDLLLCDEGHRLKNANIKTTSLLANLSCKRRVILTGTPVQNDLKEFFALVDFVNPGMVGSSLSFRHVYEDPIIASQQPGVSTSEKELGTSRASQLNRITSLFTLRRTQEIINRYLPPKVEFVVFCQPSETQLSVYNDIVGCRSVRQIFNSMDASDHLSAILCLRKLCNHPALLAHTSNTEGSSELAKEIANLLPNHIEPNKFEEADSGKLAVVSCILWALSETGKEKIVIVSNYTTTLDMLAQLCKKYNYSYLRLDGSTPTSKRQSLVDQFNGYSNAKIFLLSAKAGGVGLNLVGASRILLYDIDWNPATDLQAMARVWRDGQKRKVHIYRLLMTGSLDEKMYQRQIKKQSLSGAVVDARDSEKVHFSTAELKDLFRVHSNTNCLTHDLLNCKCDLSGDISYTQEVQEPSQQERGCQLHTVGNSMNTSNTTMDQLQNWGHLGQPFSPDVFKDQCLEAASDFITFLFRNESSHVPMLV